MAGAEPRHRADDRRHVHRCDIHPAAMGAGRGTRDPDSGLALVLCRAPVRPVRLARRSSAARDGGRRPSNTLSCSGLPGPSSAHSGHLPGRGPARMKKIMVLSILSIPAACSTSAIAQEATVSQGQRLSEVTWTQEGSYQWNRPDHVRWVLIRACGGGGGGGGGINFSRDPTPRSDGGTATGGGGGAGAVVTTTLLGPLTAASYAIVIGRGGGGGSSIFATSASGSNTKDRDGQSGAATSFTGPDLSFETPGAVGGAVGHPGTRFSDVQNNYEYFVTGVQSTGGAYPGGGSAQGGARGLLGLGGTASRQGYAGGGGGSVGNGGAGGEIDQSGVDGGSCAGGGGAGYLRGKDGTSAGGRGGDGSLTLVSVSSPG